MEETPPTQTEDLLDKLPDELIIDILSYLPIHDAAKTSVLSRRWRNLWRYINGVHICLVRSTHPENLKIDASYFSGKLVPLLQSSKIRKLHVEIVPHSYMADLFDSWIQFAVDHNAEDVYLDFINEPYQIRNYCPLLPTNLFQSRSLTNLRLKNCRIKLPSSVNLPRLRSLVVKHVLWQGTVEAEKLITNCPTLERLSITQCYLLDKFSINHSNLKSLVIGFNKGVTINTPALETLEFRDEFLNCGRDGYVFKDLSSLVKCKFQTFCSFDSVKRAALRKIVCDLSHVKLIQLCRNCIQGLSMTEPSQPIDWTCLHLEILCPTPCLQNLTLETTVVKKFIKNKWWKWLKSSLSTLLPKLETLEIQ